MTVHVHPAGVARIRGTLEGSLLIEPGGTAHVFGAVPEDLRNRGRLTLAGMVRGSIETIDGGAYSTSTALAHRVPQGDRRSGRRRQD